MSAPARIGKLTFILVPTADVDQRDIVRTAQQACCIAVREGLYPMHPLLHYGMFMPNDELDATHLRDRSLWWAKRASALWLVYPKEKCDLDPLTYDIISHNETTGYVQRRRSDPARMPISRLSWRQDTDAYQISRMTKEELSMLLRCNIVSGLLRGGLE